MRAIVLGADGKAREGVNFTSLDPDEVTFDLPGFFNSDLSTWAKTASVIKALDLVITVDTAVAHLAGALGVPVWLLNRHATDWRWCLNHPTSTPWYPSMRIFRQGSTGEGWGPVLSQVSEALGEFVKEHKK